MHLFYNEQFQQKIMKSNLTVNLFVTKLTESLKVGLQQPYASNDIGGRWNSRRIHSIALVDYCDKNSDDSQHNRQNCLNKPADQPENKLKALTSVYKYIVQWARHL